MTQLLETRIPEGGQIPKDVLPYKNGHTFSESLQGVVDWHRQVIRDQVELDSLDHLDVLGGAQLSGQNGVNVRPLYHDAIPQEISERIDVINKTGVINTGVRNLNSPENADLVRVAEAELRNPDNNAFVVIPCMPAEAESARGVAQYVNETMQDPKRTLVMNARDADSIKQAAEGLAPVMGQNEVLQNVNWPGLIESGILPRNFPLIKLDNGGIVPDTRVLSIRKGTTLLGAQLTALTLQNVGILPEGHIKILGHDGDITNPDVYKALHYLGLGLAVDPTARTNTLRTGPGRNNELWVQLTNTYKLMASLAMRREALMASDKTSALEKSNIEMLNDRIGIKGKEVQTLMSMGYVLGAWGWPLTGEREFDPHVMTSSGMDVETTYSVAYAGEDLVTGTRKTLQVSNGNPKEENGESDPTREFSLIGGCANWQWAMIEYSLRIDRMPHQWTHSDIAGFNMLYGGQPSPLSVQSSMLHQPNVTTQGRLGYVYPSAASLIEDGFVDHANILSNWMKNNNQYL